jgi:hypothetical protein
VSAGTPVSLWSSSWGTDYGKLVTSQEEQDADFSVSPLEIDPDEENAQHGWGPEYGEAITGTILAITGIIGSATGGTLAIIGAARRARERRRARQTALKQSALSRLRARQAAVAGRKEEAQAAIAQSRAQIAQVRAQSQAEKGPGIVFPAAAALAIFSLIAYRASKT